MLTIKRELLPAAESVVREELAKFKAELAAFPTTVGIPAPFPAFDILRDILADPDQDFIVYEKREQPDPALYDSVENQDGTWTSTPKDPAVIDAERKARIPRTVTMRQARRALRAAGLLPTVDAAIASMPGAAGEDARIDWEYSGEVQRDKALVQGLSASLGLTEAQLDGLFTAAAAL